MELQDIIGQYNTVGVSGSRSIVPIKKCLEVAQLIAPYATVAAGCQRGVDSFFRAQFPNSAVFVAREFGNGRSSYARRSIALVSFLKQCNGLLISFPSAACPPSLSPSPDSNKCFAGFGSGTWATTALAVGLGVPTIICGEESWLPSDWVWGWGLLKLEGKYLSYFGCPNARGCEPTGMQLVIENLLF